MPVSVIWVGILKGNPSPNASLVFANWLLSKEGQLAEKVYDFAGDPFFRRNGLLYSDVPELEDQYLKTLKDK